MNPPKSEFLVFKENPQKKFFLLFRLSFRFINTRRTNVLLVGIFENVQQKLLTIKTAIFGHFWRLKTIFVRFQNTDQNNMCVSIVFKAKTKEKYEEIFFLQFLFQNSKMPFLGVNHLFS